MCRFIAYVGKPKQVSSLVYQPQYSLLKQSKAGEGELSTNGDGFGLSWYDQSRAYRYRSTQPIWNDHNLKTLGEYIHTHCFLAHIRASTVGYVTESNTHPFLHQKDSFVHNGTIRNFSAIKRSLHQLLEDHLYHSIQGQTDSESLFYLIQHFRLQGASLQEAIVRAFSWVKQQQVSQSDASFSRLNIAITDGDQLIATRFASKGQKSLPLYYHRSDQGVVIASRRLTSSKKWVVFPENHLLVTGVKQSIFTLTPIVLKT